MYYILHALCAFLVTFFAVVFDFSKHYGVSFSEVTSKLGNLDTFTMNYLILMFIFVAVIRITYELLPVRKMYFPIILLIIVLVLPLPRIFKYLLAFTCISLYCSHETIDHIKWAKNRIRPTNKKDI